MKQRVLVFAPSLSAVSGVSTHVKLLLASDLVNEFELVHFQVGSEGRSESGPRKLVRFLVSPWQLARHIIRHRPVVVHINTSMERKAFWRDLVYLLVAKATHSRVLTQIHGGALPRAFFPDSRWRTWILRQMLRMSDAVTVLSTEEYAAYSAFDRHIRLHLVPNAIPASDIVGRRRTFNSKSPLRLVYVGRLIAAKGLFVAIEALQQLSLAGHQFLFSIAGDGPDEAALRVAVFQAGLDHCVRFLGGVFDEAKWDLWLESDILVFPTWWREGLPYSLLEAMAAGCVPVTTRVAAIPDIMQEGIHGLFVPLRDPLAVARAIAKLDADRELLAKMANSGKQRVLEYYTVERLAGDLRKLYLSLT